MPALKPTRIHGAIVWLGRVPHRDTPEIVTQALMEMQLTFAGCDGETHAGLTRSSCSRVTAQYPKGTTIANTRQLSIVSAEELAQLADALKLQSVDPAWLGASIVLSGIPDFSHVPPASRLISQTGVSVTVDMQNRPCQFPARTIETAQPGHGHAFKAAAKGLRGVTAWVERPGTLRTGDIMTLHVPDQRPWAPQMDMFDA
jgi:hypothetical protein